jgi:methionyl-tRNA formyltransferase
VKVVFMGTPSFAVPSLRALHEAKHEIPLVVTQPDRPAGRGRSVRASAVKEFALAHEMPIEQPQRLRDPAFTALLRAVGMDVIAVSAYGKILPRELLDLPPLGAVNVHGSILPKYRGAAPIQRAILAGEPTSGITILQMNERMDAGDILLQEEIPVRPDDTAATLGARLAELGADLLLSALDGLSRGTLAPRPQDDAQATLAPMVRREEGAVQWSRSAVEIERAVRAFSPWPSAYTRHRGKLLKIRRAAVVPAPADDAAPGAVVRAAAGEIDVATGSGRLRLLEVQLEGKRRLSAGEFLAGHSIREGDRLGETTG